MATAGSRHSLSPVRVPRAGLPLARLLLRICGAGLLGAMAGIHLYLWFTGYQGLSVIGPLFLVNAIGGVVLAIAVLATPVRFLGVLALLAALFTAGTLGGLLVSLRPSGLFGFQETIGAPLVTTTIGVESAGVVVLGVLGAVAALSPGGRRS